MVFEVLFSADVLLKRKYYAFLLGAFFSLVSIMLSIYLFPSNFIVFSIAFISLLLFPTISRLLELQKDIEKRGSRLDMNAFVREHKDILLVYILLFLGITAAFMAFSAIMPQAMMSHLFQNQADLAFSMYSSPDFIEFGDFFLIIGNNMRVIIVCCIAAYFFGAGMMLMIAWNASVWGTIFGTMIKNSSLLPGWNPLVYLLFMSIAILPYLVIEASGYLMAGISGGMVSKALESDGVPSRRFEIIIKKSLVFLWLAFVLIFVAALVESQLTPAMVKMLFG